MQAVAGMGASTLLGSEPHCLVAVMPRLQSMKSFCNGSIPIKQCQHLINRPAKMVFWLQDYEEGAEGEGLLPLMWDRSDQSKLFNACVSFGLDLRVLSGCGAQALYKNVGIKSCQAEACALATGL